MTMSNRTHVLIATSVCLLIAVVWRFVPNPAVALVISVLPLGILVVISQTFWFVTLFVLFSFFRIHEVVPALYPLKIPLLLSLGALSAMLWHSLLSRALQI